MKVRTVLVIAVFAAVGAALGGTAAAAPPAGAGDIARSYLAGRIDLTGGNDLEVERISSSGLVKLRRNHRGVPILGGSVHVRLGPGGEVQAATADRGTVPRELSVEPAVSASEAMRVASDGLYDDGRGGRLVVWAMPKRKARLAWVMELPLDWQTLTQWRVLVDAQTGNVLWRENRLQTVKGKAYAGGAPGVGALEVVDLQVTAGSTSLKNSDFIARNCLDKNTCPWSFSGTKFHHCETVPKALADSNGDFMYDRPTLDTEPEDEFSEVQMFYHSTRAMQKFRSLGLPALEYQPMPVYMNMRLPAASNASCSSFAPLEEFDNAFFTTGGAFGPFPSTPALVFGQGETVDYAYDGDVVAHELTHAMQNVLYEDFFFAYTDELGLNREGHGMNEATADFMAAATYEDPVLSDYALKDFEVRDLTIFKKCPDAIVGEEHFDAEMFRSGMWSGRMALAEAERTTFDQALYNAMDMFGETQSFEEAQTKVIAEVRRLLGNAQGDAVAAQFARHGLNGCSSRVADMDMGELWPLLFITSVFGDATKMPATVQWRLNLDKPYDRIVMTSDNINPRGLGMGVVTKVGGEPIKWNPDTLTHDGNETSAVTAGAFATIIPGPFPAGPVVLQLVSYAQGDFIMFDTAFRAENITRTPDAGTTGGMGEGGGCAVGGGGGTLLALAALLATRRRRRRG